MLAVGYYFNAALGFNGLTLRVYGLVRYVVVISVAAALANVAINLVLIPPYGAVGAAVGTCATLVVHNILKQAGLRKGTGIGVFDREHLRVYGAIVVTALLLLAVQVLLGPPAAVSARARGRGVGGPAVRHALNAARGRDVPRVAPRARSAQDGGLTWTASAS